MKKIILSTSAGIAVALVHATDLQSQDQKISYAIGTQMGETIATNVDGAIAVDYDAFFAGVTDGVLKKKPQLSAEEMASLMQVFAQKAQVYSQKQAAEEAKKNALESQLYLEQNKVKDGVKTTTSGLQYRVIKAGEGNKPSAADTVKVHYKGTLIDGTEFDSSYKRGEPVEFPLNAVIKGWTEGLQMMSVGSHYELVIPAELAYGMNAPASIGPNQTLVFEVELLDVKTAAKKAAEEKASDK